MNFEFQQVYDAQVIKHIQISNVTSRNSVQCQQYQSRMLTGILTLCGSSK